MVQEEWEWQAEQDCLGCLLTKADTCGGSCVLFSHYVWNWDLYTRIRGLINNMPKGQGESLGLLHQQLVKGQVLCSTTSHITKSGMYLILDALGTHQNPTDAWGQPLLFLRYTDVEQWLSLMQEEGHDTERWHPYRW